MKIKITKLVASGNDFVLLDRRDTIAPVELSSLAEKICNRKFGIGADGLLVLEKSRDNFFKMRIFNADGSEAEMCGNGARCVAYYLKEKRITFDKQISIKTKAGLLLAKIEDNTIAIKMTKPKGIKLDILLTLGGRRVKVNFVNTGVPHVVVLSEGIDSFDVFSLGRLIRNHRRFRPKGTNVNFIEPISTNKIKIRTYERGVEQETLACGTGSVASAIIYFLKLKQSDLINDLRFFSCFIQTRSGEVLEVNFDITDKTIENIWLKGKAKIICEGVYYV